MSCQEHPSHEHQHGTGCGHKTVQHEGHTDYVHDGHLHNVHAGHVDEHQVAVSTSNPVTCKPCGGHDQKHEHAAGCGHERIPHGDHVDYAVAGQLHHAHGDHCDDHGNITMT